MSVQMAEGLLAVIWLDRCRQAQLLAEAGNDIRQVAHVLLAPFIAQQRWGLDTPVLDDEGKVFEAGVLNFNPVGWGADLEHPHFLEQCMLGGIVADVQRGEFQNIEYYMRRTEFFAGIRRGSLRRLPEGSRMR